MRTLDDLSQKNIETKVRLVFPAAVLLILLRGGSSSFALKKKGDIAEYIVNDSTSSESYQHGISHEKASVGKYF